MTTETEAVSIEKGTISWFLYWMARAFATTVLWAVCIAIGFVGMIVIVGPLLGFTLGMWGTVAIWWADDYKTPKGVNPEEQGMGYQLSCWLGKSIASVSLWIGCFYLGYFGMIILIGPLIALAIAFLGTIVIWAPQTFEKYKNIERNTE